MGAMKNFFIELMEAVEQLDATGNNDELNKLVAKYGDITISEIELAREANQAFV
jgi:hypothetical protein